MLKLSAKLNRNINVKKQKANLNNVRRRLEIKGKDVEGEMKKIGSKIEQRMKERRDRHRETADDGMEIEFEEKSLLSGSKKKENREKLQNVSQRAKWFKSDNNAEIRRRKIQKISMKQGEAGDADRRITIKKPKHLFAGKSSLGTSNKR